MVTVSKSYKYKAIRVGTDWKLLIISDSPHFFRRHGHRLVISPMATAVAKGQKPMNTQIRSKYSASSFPPITPLTGKICQWPKIIRECVERPLATTVARVSTGLVVTLTTLCSFHSLIIEHDEQLHCEYKERNATEKGFITYANVLIKISSPVTSEKFSFA